MRNLVLLALLLAIAGCSGENDGGTAPLPDLPPVGAFAAAQGDARLTLSWTNPTAATFAGVVIRRATAGAPVGPADGEPVYDGPDSGLVDPGLRNGTRYFYSAFAYDEGGRFAPGASLDAVPNPAGPVQILFAGVGEGPGPHGIFDPSLAADPISGRLWMSYSEVIDSALWPGRNAWIQTRLAFSDDHGATWTDSGAALNAAQDITLPFPAPDDAGTWVNEVSSLVHDAAAPAAERWKLLWHRYLVVNGVRRFDHGWIACRTAADPAATWSDERKLFAGSLYDGDDDVIIGPPEVRVDRLHPELNPTLVLSEPGLLATPAGLYATMIAADGTVANGRIILLRLPTGGGTWDYRGSFLTSAQDGPALGYDGFSAPALYAHEGGFRLIATPQTADYYLGTLVFAVTGLETAAIARAAGMPEVVFSHFGTPGSFNGAAGYVREATASGVIYSEAKPTAPIVFEMFASRRNP